MKIVEEGKQGMRQERWSSSVRSSGPISCWINSLLNSWKGGQKTRASLIKIFSSFHSPCTNELLPLPLAFMFREIWGCLYVLLHICQHGWNGQCAQMLLGWAEGITVSSAPTLFVNTVSQHCFWKMQSCLSLAASSSLTPPWYLLLHIYKRSCEL